MRPVLVAVMGPTASGKTALAEAVADEIGARLINADNFQAYRGMDIGTAKPDRKAEYALIDIKDPSEEFGMGEWVRRAAEELRSVFDTGRSAVLVGGSGLNVRALLEGYDDIAGAPPPELRAALNAKTLEELQHMLAERDPAAYAKVDLKNRVRVQRAVERLDSPREEAPQLPPFTTVKIARDVDPYTLGMVIDRRTSEMVQNGWLAEVAALREAGCSLSDPGLKAHGYRWLWRHLEGEIDLVEAVRLTSAEVRQYAKRQRTWLRTEPRLDMIDDARDVVAQAMRRIHAAQMQVN